MVAQHHHTEESCIVKRTDALALRLLITLRTILPNEPTANLLRCVAELLS